MKERKEIRAAFRMLDYSQYGGAPLLGVKGCCVIGHGKSNATAIKHGIRTAADFFTSGVNARIAVCSTGFRMAQKICSP